MQGKNQDLSTWTFNLGWKCSKVSNVLGFHLVKVLNLGSQAEDMNVTLSVDTYMGDLLQRLIDRHACFLAEDGNSFWNFGSS